MSFQGRATFVSAELTPLLERTRLPCRVLSVHERVCNLEVADHYLVALVAPEVERGPFHVGLPVSLAFKTWCHPGDHGYVQQGTLYLPRLVVRCGGARVWTPYLRPAPVVWASDVLIRYTRWVLSHHHPPLVTAVEQQVGPVLTRLAREAAHGLVHFQDEVLVDALERLIGLGPGLTPAGDDVIVGLMAGWYILGRVDDQEPRRRRLSRRVEELTGRTHRLSQAWLRFACRGAFAEPWHHLADALSHTDRTSLLTCLIRLVRQGSTSGYYALVGFKAIMEALAADGHP